MKISQIIAEGRPLFSFEFFPPKDDVAAAKLLDTIAELKDLRPDFVSVTYGAGGSTRAKTLELVAHIKNKIGIESMAHLTCVGHSKDEISGILKELYDSGIENILALRGDPPRGESSFKPHPNGFHYANELAAEIAKWNPSIPDAPDNRETLGGRFCFGVAGYPEKHPEALDLEVDLINLKRKVDTGASFVTTQLFFQNAHYFEFVTRARAIGIRVPIFPGIMPVTNYAQVQRFTALCGATIPRRLALELEAAQMDLDAVTRLGIEHAAQQCEELLHKGAPGIHFYTLNKSHATREILQHLRALRQSASPGLLQDI